jgi:xylan 1,4-beta-xylosidase
MKTLTNPVLPGFNADPSFVRGLDENGNTVYYIANSTFEWFPGVQIHRSYDLINWELVARPLDTVDLLDMKGDPDSGGIWAPDLTYADGLWWLVYTDVKVTEGPYKDCANYLTTAPSVFGPWTAPIHLTNSGFDASLFHDTDGKKYLVNMYWDQREYKHPFAGIQLTEYSHAKQQLLPETSRIIHQGTNVKLVEGPHLYKLQTPVGQFYYLAAAQGGTTYSHQEIIARSATLDGQFVTQPGAFNGEPFLTAYQSPFSPLQKTGHGALVEVGGSSPTNDITQNRWYFAHLTGRPVTNPNSSAIDPRGYCPLGRESAIQAVEWDVDGWPHIVGGKQGVLEVAVPELSTPEQVPSIHQGVTDRYPLPLDFQTLRIPFTEQIGQYTPASSVTSVPAKQLNGQSWDNSNFGELTLFGRESLSSTHTQAHIARRWQSLSFVAEVFVEFNPTTYQEQAGLTAYYNTRHWTMFNITNSGSGLPHNVADVDYVGTESNQRVLEITQVDRNCQTSVLGASNSQIVVPDSVRSVGLKLVVTGITYHYEYSFDSGTTWHQAGGDLSSAVLSDDYVLETYGGFFTGAFVGLACIDGTGKGKPAKFTNFLQKTLTNSSQCVNICTILQKIL